MQEYVIHIDFVDCPGLGYEIFRLTELNQVDKIAMEVLPNHGMVIKFRCVSEEQAQKLAGDLTLVSGVKSIVFRDQMPYEEREHELRTILDSVSEGILAVNKKGRISHINEVSCRLLQCGKGVAGLSAAELLGASSLVLDTLRTGKSYRLKEERLQQGGKAIDLFTSTTPVRNEKGQIIGSVATIKDVKQVATMLSKVDKMRRLRSFDDIVYQSPKMRQLVGYASTVAKSSSTVLLRGESGTGKELLAAAIHTEGPRYKAPFLAVNCAALPDTLLESELFGYEEGAFTGAAKGGKKGLFEQADGGTLFLDEIGEISPSVQVRLLRVLQEGTIRRVGGVNEIEVDVRIIAATHCDLEAMICRREFREDLYYRLNVIPLTIPPLRERKEDIPLLAQYLIRKICTKLEKTVVRLTRESIGLLMNQEWPGNVRQLENTLERVINMIDATEIQPGHLRAWTDLSASKRNGGNLYWDKEGLQFELSPDGRWPHLREIVAGVEKEVIQRVLKKYPSSRLAGQVLGVSNTTILNKMKAYGIEE
ncbi:sigma-54 interaction domain-containing protein [Lucifera butyrica]|nr:sigma 54-interacting transcriptional regulator [Lucifera butyrica]